MMGRMSKSSLTFMDDLPESSGHARYGAFDELCANPGKWVEYWGAQKSVYQVVRQTRRDGFTFEAKIRNRKGYVRAVKS